MAGQTLELVLQALGIALAQTHGFDPVQKATFDGPTGHYTGAYAILAYRFTLDGRRFSSKSQLQEILPEDAYRVLRDYVTCHGWIDEKAVSAASAQSRHHRVQITPRAQINANLAPKEVLVAAIAPIAGRRFCYRIDTDPGAMERDDPKRYFPPGTTRDPASFPLREDYKYDVSEQGWVYMKFDIQGASKIADWIIAQRNMRPFKSYADFYSRLREQMDSPTGGVLDDAMPDPAKGTVSLFPPQGGFPQGENIAAVMSAPWFKDFCRQAGYGMLLANFSPTFASNSTCPNSASYLPIDKGSLLWPQREDAASPQGNVVPRQTYDFCFDTHGVYEITSLGQIRGKQGEVLAQEKIFSVVRTMDQITFRSQPDFEMNDVALHDDRFDWTSYPENKIFFGSSDAVPPALADPDPVPYGHIEVAPRLRYDDGQLIAARDLAHAKFGNPIFGDFFEGPTPGLNPGAYLHADLYDKTEGLPNRNDPPVYARARGEAPNSTLGVHSTAPWVRNDPDPKWTVLGGLGTLFRDGYYTSYRRGRDKTLWFRAGAGRGATSHPNNDTSPNADDNDNNQGALGQGTGAPPETETASEAHKGNVYYRKGGIEFWYKPDYDWAYRDPGGQFVATPLFCGLASATRVWMNPGDPTADPPYGPAPMMVGATPKETPSDGTQLYIFRNTDGFLRATRIYFRAVGDPSDPTPGHDLPERLKDAFPGDGYPTPDTEPGWFVRGPYKQNPGPDVGAIERYREASIAMPYQAATTPGGQPSGYPWPPAELKKDPYEVYARIDAWVPFDPQGLTSPLVRWKSNEWHHIAVYWDDGASVSGPDPDKNVKIFVDGVRASQAYGLPENPTGANQWQFCRLNEPPIYEKGGQKCQFPRDSLYVGGIERRLARVGGGIFKHSNTVRASGSGSADEALIQLFACGTIDDVIVFDGDQPNPTVGGPLTRFMPKATYEQIVDLASRFPEGNQPLELAKISWQALLPTRHGGEKAAPTGAGGVTVSLVSNSGAKLQAPGKAPAPSVSYTNMQADYGYANLVEGSGPAVIQPGQTFKYKVELFAATFAAGEPIAMYPEMRQIDTPALGEVTVSYFLPFQDTLLKERIVD
jgi:hypothetical protein